MLLKSCLWVAWEVVLHSDFDPEFDALALDVQDELLAQAELLRAFGPTLDECFDRHLDRLKAAGRTR